MLLTIMNITPSLFRKLLLLSIILAVIGILLDIMLPNLIPAPLYQAQEEVDQAAWSTEFIVLLLIISIPVIIVNIISVVGLFFFRPWAPRIAIIATLLSFMIYPLLGYSLSSGWALALTDFSTLLWGVVLTLTYCSPIRKRFAHRK
jgi:urea transporter